MNGLGSAIRLRCVCVCLILQLLLKLLLNEVTLDLVVVVYRDPV